MKTKYIILNHRNKTAQVFDRKLDAIYEHVKYRRNTGVQYMERPSNRVKQATKGFALQRKGE